MNVFIIGPMVPVDDGVSLASSTQRIKNAVTKLIAKLGLADCHVTAPEDLQGSVIPTDVFSQIDAADLVIADLPEVSNSAFCDTEGNYATRPSPNVYYELAYVDSLGLPTVLVGRKQTELPFYFKQMRFIAMENATVPALIEALKGPLLAYAGGSEDVDLCANPLRDFYGAAVIDVSAATGLAISYYRNFIFPLIRNDGVGIIEKSANRAVSGVLVVVPEDLSKQVPDQSALGRLVTEAFPKKRLEQDVVLERPGSRGFTVNMVDRLVIDLASAPYALHYSPRVQRLVKRNLKADVREKLVISMVNRMLVIFIEELKSKLSTTPDTSKEKCSIVRLSGAAAELKRLEALGWF